MSRGCVDTALPAACTTSAVVRFGALELTLKVTAGPRTLEETITKELRTAPAPRAGSLQLHRKHGHAYETHVPRVTSAPQSTDSTDRRCSSDPHTTVLVRKVQINPNKPTRSSRYSYKGKTVMETDFGIWPPREPWNQKQKGKRLVF